jgi:membrane protease YdiL (CAAX protease family)
MYPWRRVVAVSLAAGLVGLAAYGVTEHLGWHFPSFGALAGGVVWKVAMLVILVHGFTRWEGRRPNAADLGWRGHNGSQGRTKAAVLGLLACGVLAVVVNQVFPSAGNAEAYGDVHKAGLALTLAELLVRYPLTVFAEESFFRGWLQPRLPRWAPVMSGLLFAGFHLQQATTIPSLLPLGVGLGIIRWWTGDVRTTAAIHYASNAAFFLSTYV